MSAGIARCRPAIPIQKNILKKLSRKNHAVMKEAPETNSGASFMGAPPWLPYGVPRGIMKGVVEIFFETIR